MTNFLNPLEIIVKLMNTIGNLSLRIARNIDRKINRSRVIKEGGDRSLFQTKHGDFFWLNSTGYIDKCLAQSGIFEPWSTQIVKRLVKEGDTVLDIGANIGYYSVLMSKIVGESGRVVCFEPTTHYGKVLDMNIAINNLKNVEIYKIGLSDKQQELLIQIGESSATLHSPGNKPLKLSETIKLDTLDNFLKKQNLSKIDFIKIDVDGHEPKFLEGAWSTLEKFNPVILLEISHQHYLNAGYTAWGFYDLLKEKGYNIYHEDGLVEIIDKEYFLQTCGNFSFSANIVIAKEKLH